ncbi:MAG: hypothetical protein JOY95_05090 [Silvibacterium sp.]|nr:hypothetical protein [Silvibacterium sp.]
MSKAEAYARVGIPCKSKNRRPGDKWPTEMNATPSPNEAGADVIAWKRSS